MRLPGEIIKGILARAALALLRVYLGTLLVLAGLSHLRGYPHELIVPDAELIAGVVNWGELLVGLLLLLGVMTRLAAAAALLLTIDSMLAHGSWRWLPSSSDAALAVMSLAVLIGAAGRTLGLDSILARRWPRSPFW